MDNMDKEKKSKEFIYFQIDKEFKKDVKKLAEKNGLKVGPYIKWLLKQELNKSK